MPLHLTDHWCGDSSAKSFQRLLLVGLDPVLRLLRRSAKSVVFCEAHVEGGILRVSVVLELLLGLPMDKFTEL